MPRSSSASSSPSHNLDRLQRSRQHIGSYRHDLLVALRVVDRVEKEMLRAEWESWVWSEAAKCKQVNEVIKKGSEKDTEGLRRWWGDYCGSCLQEVGQMKGL
jgi:hypothetical protein